MHVLVPAALAALAVAAVAQSPDARVAARWPGAKIAKAAEAEFEGFVASRPATERAALHAAFLDAQYAAQGVRGPHRAPRSFLVTSAPGPRVATGGRDLGVPEGPEPNGDPNGAFPGTPTPFACGDQGEGAIQTFGDEDWWRFDLTAAQDVVIVTAPGLGAAVIDDTILELRDANGALLVANDDAAGRGRFSLVTAALTPGSYFAVVRGFAGVRTGSYAVDIFCGVAGGGGRVQEPPEPNESAARAGRMNCADVAAGVVGFAGDQDWFAFTLVTAGQVTGETFPSASGAIRDTTLTLLDASGTALLFDDDGGSNLFSRIQTNLQPGTYYWSVAGFGSNTGGYELLLSCAGGGVGASFDARPGGCVGTAGVPTLSVRNLELPLAGGTFAIDFAALPAGATLFAILGFDITGTGSIPLPFDLGVIGGPGCLVEVAPDVVTPLGANAGGAVTWYLPIPDLASLVGNPFHVQGFVLDAGANALGATTSNRGDGRIGSRP